MRYKRKKPDWEPQGLGPSAPGPSALFSLKYSAELEMTKYDLFPLPVQRIYQAIGDASLTLQAWNLGIRTYEEAERWMAKKE
jgi:hypothetical protein